MSKIGAPMPTHKAPILIRENKHFRLWKNKRGYLIDPIGTNRLLLYKTQREAVDAWEKLNRPRREPVQERDDGKESQVAAPQGISRLALPPRTCPPRQVVQAVVPPHSSKNRERHRHPQGEVSQPPHLPIASMSRFTHPEIRKN